MAFGALAVAAVLETLLILRAAARVRRDGARLSAALEEGEASDGSRVNLAVGADGWRVLVALLLAVLGFAFLAALLALRG